MAGDAGQGGHHAVTLRQMGAQRRAAVALWTHYPALAQHLLDARNNVEAAAAVACVASCKIV